MDVGQQTSNDYEASKLAAEQAVRSAEWLNHVTVFRPSIIAGDSRTGFTSTFHGFYFPLKISMNLSRLGAFSELFDLKGLLSTMGLDGTERKNFVPVDWVSSVIAKAVTSSELQGQTYHLTSQHSVTLSTMVNVISEAVQKAYTSCEMKKPTTTDLEWMRNQFRLQMTAYRSYWRDDPEFCNANTQRMAEDLPCPPVTEATMNRWCKYAIDQNFQPPVFSAKNYEFDIHALLETRFSALDTNMPNVRLQVNGPGGGHWQLCWTNERITSVRRGFIPRCSDTTLYLNTNTFRNLARGLISAERAILAGQMLVQGDSKDAARIIEQLTKNCWNERIESNAKTTTP